MILINFLSSHFSQLNSILNASLYNLKEAYSANLLVKGFFQTENIHYIYFNAAMNFLYLHFKVPD